MHYLIDEFSYPRKNAVKHRLCQLAGEGVLLAGMECAEQCQILADLNFGSVSELGTRLQVRFAERAEGIESRIKADLQEL